jgi:hypothetical protein
VVRLKKKEVRSRNFVIIAVKPTDAHRSCDPVRRRRMRKRNEKKEERRSRRKKDEQMSGEEDGR